MVGPLINRGGRATPGGPLAHKTPIGGPRVPSASKAPRNHSSKKGYTGSRAGLGRSASGTVTRSGPKGPRAFGGSVNLPPRMRGTASKVSFKPASKGPSIFARIRNRAAAFGF
jgi:hypothetical protein